MAEKRTEIDVDRCSWLANMAINNANVALRGRLPLDETRAAVILAATLLRQAADELMQHAVRLQEKAKHTARSPLELRPGELN